MTLRDQNAKLRQENARLGLDLKKALEDLALLDNCEVCMYGQTGRCTATKEQTMGAAASFGEGGNQRMTNYELANALRSTGR